MKYHIDEKNTKPAYLQLYEQLRSDIVGGILPYGGKLPSKRILAEETGVSVITVQHSYAILCDEGYVESRQRSGYYVIYKESDFISAPDTAAAASLTHTPAGHHVKTDFPFSVLSKTMRRVLLDYGDDILIKSPNHGCPELRSAIAAYLTRSNGMQVRPDQIIIGSGAEHLYSTVVRMFGNDKVYGLENPSYQQIRMVYEGMGAKCELLQMGKEGILSTELEHTQADILHVTPFHSYPSGVTATVRKRHEYLEWAKSGNHIVIEDDFDSEFFMPGKPMDTLYMSDDSQSVVYMNTFSKSLSPSIRIGYMILPEKYLDVYREKVGDFSCTVPVLDQYVLAEFIDKGHFEQHLNRVRRHR